MCFNFPLKYINKIQQDAIVCRHLFTAKLLYKFLPHTLHVCGRNLITGLTSAASPSVEISSTCKVGQKLGVSLPLLICSPSAWPSRLLYRRVRKSRRDLRITLYINKYIYIYIYMCVCVYGSNVASIFSRDKPFF